MTAPSHVYRRQFQCLLVIMAIAALARGWYLLEVVHAPDFTELRQDMSVQDYHARAILSGDWTVPEGRSDPEMTTTPFYRPPGYAYLLSAIYFFSGGSYLAPRLFNVLLGLMSIALMWRLARPIFGVFAAHCTAALMALYWGCIYYEGEVNDPAVFVFLLPCLMLSLRQWTVAYQARWAALAGLITGCYALMRPNILLFGPFMALWILALGLRAGKPMRVLRAWVVLAGVTALTILPVTMRNYAVSGEFVPISTYFGENLYIGNCEYADGYTSWTPYLQHLEGSGQFSVWEYARIVRGLGRELGNEHLTHSEASKIFAQRAVEWMGDNKLKTAQLFLKRALLFWSPLEITENKVVYYEKAHYAPLKYLPGFPHAAALFFFGVLLLLHDWRRGTLFPAKLEKDKDAATAGAMILLMLGFVLIYFASFLPFFVNARARHPIIGFLFLFGAYGLYRLLSAYRAGGFKRVLPLAALLALLYVAAATPWAPYTPDLARWHYARADSWLRAGETELAAAEAETMLETDYSYYMPFRLGHAFAAAGKHELAARLLQAALAPDNGEQPTVYRQDLYFHIGAAWAQANDDEAAKAAFEEALRLNPNDARAHNDLGVLYEKQGRLDEALEAYRAAVAAQPAFALAWSNLGDLAGRQGDHETAVAAFSKAVESAPEAVEHHYNLALHLAASGDRLRAVMRYEIALDLAPKHLRAMNNLALLLAEQGKNDEAQALLEQALALQPDFALARANLGNLHIALGRIEAGIQTYLDGLKADPNNAELHNGLGFHYAAQGRGEEARTHYEQALRAAPDYDRARINLARLHLDEGRLEEALVQMEHLTKKHPDNAELHVEVGNIQARLGRYDAAAAAYQQALQADPNNEAAQRNLEVLSRKTR